MYRQRQAKTSGERQPTVRHLYLAQGLSVATSPVCVLTSFHYYTSSSYFFVSPTMSEPNATHSPAMSIAKQLNGITETDANKGATVHTFDPDASPQAKAAAAGQGKDQLESITNAGNGEGGKGEYHLPYLVTLIHTPRRGHSRHGTRPTHHSHNYHLRCRRDAR